ncbi:MAG: glycosyltransferase family 39 protein [Thermoleophilia bacterium]
MTNNLAEIFARSQKYQTAFSLAVIAIATIVITVPFAAQPFSIDGPETIAFAQRQIEQPFSQDLRDHIDNRGIYYDSYLETHPKFLPIYLSVIIRIIGEPSEIPIHISLMIFPFIGATAMYYLGRRFRVSGIAAAMLFLVSPMLMVNAHTEMVDVPGTALTVAAIAAFITAVDRDRNWLLAVASLLMLLASQTFFQGLLVLPLALAYLLINHRFKFKYFLPIISTALLFGAYLLAVVSAYDQFPRFTYRTRLVSTAPASALAHLRANLTIVGGTLFFPFVAVAGFFTRWTGSLVFCATSVITWSWSIVKYSLDEYSFSDMLLLSIMLPTGMTITYVLIERFALALSRNDIRNSRKGRDLIFLAIWYLGVLAYTTLLLPYPAPRYLLAIAPAAILGLLILWRSQIRISLVRFGLAGSAIALTLVFSTILSLTAYNAARNGKVAAEWAIENYADQNGVWYNGTFGFGYYLERSGFRRLPGVENELFTQTSKPLPPVEPQPGDYVVYSEMNGAWVPYPSVMQRLRIDAYLPLYNNQIFSMPCAGTTRCWWVASFLPFQIDTIGELSDKVTVWRIADEPNPLDESQYELYREVGITWIKDLEER